MNNLIDVDIRVNDKSLRQYPFQKRLFVEAKDGSEYSVKIKNNRWERVLAVITVDGINVIDGQAGGSSKAGYVINGYASLDVKGFRTSNDNVNVFKFSKKSESYAAKSEVTQGDTRNCGVIGVEIFAEKEKPRPKIERIIEKEYIPYPVYTPPPQLPIVYWLTNNTSAATPMWNNMSSMTRSATNSLEGRGSSALCGGLQDSEIEYSCNFMSQVEPDMAANMGERKRSFDMGTEFSNKEISDRVTEVEFETGSLLTTLTIYYASRSSLLDMGVPIAKETQISFPQAFPSKFCKPPQK